MEPRTVIEVERRGSGMNSGLIVLTVLALLAAAVGLFVMAGGPARFGGAAGPSQTNINVPAPAAQTVPQINLPGQIDVNINTQPAAPAVAPQVAVPGAPAAQLPVPAAPAVQLPSIPAPGVSATGGL